MEIFEKNLLDEKERIFEKNLLDEKRGFLKKIYSMEREEIWENFRGVLKCLKEFFQKFAR